MQERKLLQRPVLKGYLRIFAFNKKINSEGEMCCWNKNYVVAALQKLSINIAVTCYNDKTGNCVIKHPFIINDWTL